MSINLFFFFSGYFVLFAVDSDIGVFFFFPLISFSFPFPSFFLWRKLLLVSTLIHISSKLTQVIFNEMFFIFYECVNFKRGTWQNSFWSLYHYLLKIIFWHWLLWLSILSNEVAKFTVKMVFSIPVVVAFDLFWSIISDLYSLHLSPASIRYFIKCHCLNSVVKPLGSPIKVPYNNTSMCTLCSSLFHIVSGRSNPKAARRANSWSSHLSKP